MHPTGFNHFSRRRVPVLELDQVVQQLPMAKQLRLFGYSGIALLNITVEVLCAF